MMLRVEEHLFIAVQSLQVQLERETNEVMRQLQLSRKNEVKQLAKVHKDKDE